MNFRRYMDYWINKPRYRMSFLQEENEKPVNLGIIGDDVRKAFEDFSKLIKSKNYALCGGLAVSKYTEPRFTADIDIIVLDEQELSKIRQEINFAFKGNRRICYHRKLGTKLELLTP